MASDTLIFPNATAADYVRMHLARYKDVFTLPNYIDFSDLCQEVELDWLQQQDKFDPKKGNIDIWKWNLSRNTILNIFVKNCVIKKRTNTKTVNIDDLVPFDDMPVSEKWHQVSSASVYDEIMSSDWLDRLQLWVDKNIHYKPHRPIVMDVILEQYYKPQKSSKYYRKVNMERQRNKRNNPSRIMPTYRRGFYYDLAKKHKVTYKVVDNILQKLRMIGKRTTKQKVLAEILG